MPALPHQASHASQDSRLLDARQESSRTTHELSKRIEYQGVIPSYYEGIDAGPSPGVVVGITLGSIAGFLFIVWLLFLLNGNSGVTRTTALVEEEDYVVPASPRRQRRTRRTQEMRTRSPRRDRIVRQERIVRDRSVPVAGVAGVQPVRAPSRIRETIIIDGPERRVDGDDVVEVIEEHSSIGGGGPPRRKSRRPSGYEFADHNIFSRAVDTEIHQSCFAETKPYHNPPLANRSHSLRSPLNQQII